MPSVAFPPIQSSTLGRHFLPPPFVLREQLDRVERLFRTPLFNSFRFLRRGRPSHHADPARRTAYPRRAPYTRELGDSTSQSPQNAMPLRTAIAQWLPANPLPKRYPKANSPTSPWMARVGPSRSDSPRSPPSRTGSAAYHAPP